MTAKDISDFIAKNMGHSISFGNSDASPSADWISKAENEIGLPFPNSYKNFLCCHGGGEIHGDSIYSIFQLPFDQPLAGDVVYETLSNRKNGFLKQGEIALCFTDYGELFLMDGNNPDDGGEYPVLRQTGQQREVFADNFADFVIKFVGDAAV